MARVTAFSGPEAVCHSDNVAPVFAGLALLTAKLAPVAPDRFCFSKAHWQPRGSSGALPVGAPLEQAETHARDADPEQTREEKLNDHIAIRVDG